MHRTNPGEICARYGKISCHSKIENYFSKTFARSGTQIVRSTSLRVPIYNNSYSTLHSHASLRKRDISPLRYRAPFNAQRRQQSLSLPFDRGSIVTRASTRLHSWLHPIAAALRVTARFVVRTRPPRRVRHERLASLFYCNATESATKSINAHGNATHARCSHTTR